MDRIVTFLNNRYFVAVVIGLFLLGFARRLFGR